MSELKNCPFCGSANTMIDDIVELEGKALYTAFCGYCQSKSSNFCDYNDAVNAWNTRADGWIDVSDSSPDFDVQVLVCYIGHNFGVPTIKYTTAFLDEEKGWRYWDSNNIFGWSVTHWMPNPSNPPTTK